MSKSSINFKVVKSNSEAHNFRLGHLDYIYPELGENNRSWSASSVQEKEKEIARLCKDITGRKMQKNAEPIREAVVNLQPHHRIEDLQNLAEELRERFKIDCFQIHIHRDEGKSTDEINHHAHMLFDWQDKTTGKTLKLNRVDLSQIQTLVADVLVMERGELKENSNRERLEAVEYKRQQEELQTRKLQTYNHQLQQQNADLEQKKNEVIERINRLTAEREKPRFSSEAIALATDNSTDPTKFLHVDENLIHSAIDFLKNEIDAIENESNSTK